MSEKSSSQILFSSTLATALIAALTNPLDVLKVRIQNKSQGCNIYNQSKCVNHCHPHPAPNPLKKASLYRLVMTPNLVDHYKVLCDCLPFRSNTKALVYLIRKEGFVTLTNGLRQGVMGSITATVTYFYCYESVKKNVKKITSHQIGVPLLSALAARTITTCVAFPFEYMKTLQQSSVGVSVKKGFKSATKINSGFGSLLQRDLVFSGLYWVLVENIRSRVKTYLQSHEESFLDKTNLLVSNIIAGGVSGAIASTVTLPLDVVKTRKQLYPKEYAKRHTFGVLRDIYYKEGYEALFAGMRQRVAKVTMSCAGILTLYELFSDLMKDSPK